MKINNIEIGERKMESGNTNNENGNKIQIKSEKSNQHIKNADDGIKNNHMMNGMTHKK